MNDTHERNQRTTYVYQLWAGEECLYVGMTFQPGSRLHSHFFKPWFAGVTRIEISAYDDRDAGMLAEKRLIQDLMPPLNTAHTGRPTRRRRRGA